MTPQQAHDILVQVCVQTRATMAEHQQIQLALQVLKPQEVKDGCPADSK